MSSLYVKILDGSPGSGRPLSEHDIKDFLTTKVLNIHLGTVDEKGHANIHPAWYYFDDSKEKIYVETGRHSKKMENLSRNDTIYFCIDDPSPPPKGVRGKGNIKVFYDVNFNDRAENIYSILGKPGTSYRTGTDRCDKEG
jgi:hypothetical protein